MTASVIEGGPVATGELADIKGKTLRGGAIALFVQGTNFVVRTGSTIVLARLLTPHDFGLVAMVTGVTGFFELLKDAGLSMATVQKEQISHEQVSTLFWVNVLIGAFLTVLAAALAPVLARFYHEPRLLWVTVAIGGQFILIASGVQHRALLQRKMRFLALGVADSVSLVLGVTVGVTMALGHYGYWSLVGMTLGTAATQTVSLWVSCPWIPGLPRRGCGVRRMLQFGGTVTCNTLVVYVAYNADKILLGRFCGASPLGLYTRAQTLMNLPTSQLNSAIGSVALPALSRLQNDPERLKRYFLQGYSLVLSATVVISLVCSILGAELISVLLGPKWVGAIPIFRVLAPTAVTLALINPFGWLMFANGQTVRSLLMALVMTPLLVIGYFVGLSNGPNGVATAYSIVMTLLIVPLVVWAKWGGPVSNRDVLQAVRKPLLACAVAGVAGWACHFAMGSGIAAAWRLIAGLLVIGLVYAWMLLIVLGQKEFYLNLVKHLLPSARVAEPRIGSNL